MYVCLSVSEGRISFQLMNVLEVPTTIKMEM